MHRSLFLVCFADMYCLKFEYDRLVISGTVSNHNFPRQPFVSNQQNSENVLIKSPKKYVLVSTYSGQLAYQIYALPTAELTVHTTFTIMIFIKTRTPQGKMYLPCPSVLIENCDDKHVFGWSSCLILECHFNPLKFKLKMGLCTLFSYICSTTTNVLEQNM